MGKKIEPIINQIEKQPETRLYSDVCSLIENTKHRTQKFRRNDSCITVSDNLRKTNNLTPERGLAVDTRFCRKQRYACIRLCTSHACGVRVSATPKEFRKNDSCITVSDNLRKKGYISSQSPAWDGIINNYYIYTQ